MLVPGMLGRQGNSNSLTLRGKLLCDGKPEKGVLVKLYDDDR